jgi:hypothetical protein
MRLVTAAVGTFISVLGTTLHAQDLEPRTYSNSPIGLNFVIAGYGYASGTVLTDPAIRNSLVGLAPYLGKFRALNQIGEFHCHSFFSELRPLPVVVQ